MFQFIKIHRWAILLAFISALLIASPQIYFRYIDHGHYQDQGIEIMGASDEDEYLSQIEEVRDGYLSSGNPYFKEGKNDSYLFQPLGPIIVAFFGKIFSLDLNSTVLLERLFFPFCDFLLIYIFVLLLSRSRPAALASSAMVMLGSVILSRYGLFQLLQGISPRTEFLIFSRPIIPPLHAFFFFSFLILLFLFLEKKKWWWGMAASVFLGFSFYLYFYTGTFLFAFTGLLLIILLFQKKWPEAKMIILILLGAFLIAIPFLLNLQRASSYDTFQEVGQRQGVVNTRQPTIGLLSILLPLAFLLFFPREPRGRYVFSLALVITPFIVLNQQVITGRTLINAHYHWYCHTPLAIIFFLLILFHWLSQKRRPFLSKILAFLLIGFSIYAAIIIQRDCYRANKERIISEQRYSAPLEWLNSHLQKDQVVLADETFSSMVVIYTPFNVFHHPSAKFFLAASQDRLIDTLFLFYRLDGIKGDEAEEVFLRDRGQISSAIYGIYYRETRGDYEAIPDEILKSLARRYSASLSVPAADFIKGLLKKYQVDYVVWNKDLNPQWELPQYPFLEQAAVINNFTIYRLQ